MTKAYSYIRFSTPEQARGDSLRRQSADAEAWAQERGLMLDNSIRDLGVSAYHGANRTGGALRSFLDMVENGKVEKGSYLIVESLDRLSRETVIDAATQLFALIQAGVVVVTLSDGQEYSSERLRQDWTPLVISLAVMARAHDESRVKSHRVGKAWRKKKEAARKEGTPLTPRCPEWLEVRDDIFVERVDRVAVIRRIFRETIEGFGRRLIVDRLNVEGLPAFRGKKGWQTSSIAKIINGRAVLGEYQPHTGTHKARNRKPEGEPISDYYPAIIDEDTYWRAQAAVKSRKQSAAGRIGVSGAHILKGLAKCGECGSPMHIVNKGKPPKGAVYYVCDSAKRSMGCENKENYRMDHTERKMIHALTQLVAEDIDFKRNEVNQSSDVDTISAQLKDKEATRDRLLDLVEVAGFDDATNERFQKVVLEVKQLKESLKKAKNALKIATANYDLETRKALLDDLLRDMKSVDSRTVVETKVKLNAIIRGIVDHVTFSRLPGVQMTITNRSHFHINTDGTFAIKGGQGVGTIVLLEENISDEAFEAFFGVPQSSFDWG